MAPPKSGVCEPGSWLLAARLASRVRNGRVHGIHVKKRLSAAGASAGVLRETRYLALLERHHIATLRSRGRACARALGRSASTVAGNAPALSDRTTARVIAATYPFPLPARFEPGRDGEGSQLSVAAPCSVFTCRGPGWDCSASCTRLQRPAAAL